MKWEQFILYVLIIGIILLPCSRNQNISWDIFQEIKSNKLSSFVSREDYLTALSSENKSAAGILKKRVKNIMLKYSKSQWHCAKIRLSI